MVGCDWNYSTSKPGLFLDDPDPKDRKFNSLGSLALLIIMLLVDMLILKCSLEDFMCMEIIVPGNGWVTTEAAVF